MKRLVLMILLVMMVYWIAAARRPDSRRLDSPPRHRNGSEPRPPHIVNSRARLEAGPSSESRRALAEARRAINEARNEARQAIDEARDEVRHALDQARHEVHQAFHGGDDDSEPSSSADRPREAAEGLPVPIVPGTRVTKADLKPPVAPSSPVPPRPPSPPILAHSGEVASAAMLTRSVTGQLSATEERARSDVRATLNREVTEWLDPEVPRSWSPPARLVDGLVLENRIKPVVKDYGTLYEAELKVDVSPERRVALVEIYQGEQVRQRLAAMGGVLGFVLICLAAISGYIRTDEATRGYYTNRLRMLTAAGVGAAGVIIYQMFV